MRWLPLVVLGVALALLGATERAAAQTAPGAPTIDAVAGTPSTLTVIWSAPSDDGGATISAYHLRYTEGDPTNMDDANWTFRSRAWTSNSGSLSYVVSGLRGDTVYGVQVQAVNSTGPGAWSDPVTGATTDYGDTATTAAALVLSATTPAVVAARIGSETDKDVFSFVLAEDAELMVRSTGPVDVAGKVLNEDLTSAGANNNARLPDNPWNFLIHKYLTAGTYYASVAGHDGATGPYEIHVEILPDDIPDYFGAAATAEPGLVTAGRVGGFDSDYYKLEFSERTDFYVVVFSRHSTSGQLFDASETLIAESREYYLQGELFLGSFSRTNDTGFMLRGTGRAGTYYIEVRSTSFNDWGSYVMQVGKAPNPGRTLGTATPILPGAGAPGRISPASDADYFSISFDEDTAASVVAATAAYLPAYQELADLKITVYDEQNTPLDFHSIPHSAWEDSGRGYVAGHAFGLFEAGKTYKLRVRANAGQRAAYFLLFRPEEAYTSFATQCSALTADDAIDTFYGCQWHLNNTGQFPGGAIRDINVAEVWQAGNTGAGVSIAVVDTGLHFEHPDLNDNVDTTRNFDYLSMEYEGPYIHLPFFDTHGTAVAGLIAAEHNDIGVRGVAPDATIYSHNSLDDGTFESEADAMIRDRVTTHISSNSWGPIDSGVPEPSTSIWRMAIETGLREGDEGRGISYVFAGGNGSNPHNHDNSNLDGYANFYGVTAVCAIDHNDVRSSYSEPGANLWVCAPSSGADPPGITTTDVGGAFAFSGDEAGSGYWPGLYTDTFGGTSAAAPIVSGVVALMRSANPALTWRDVKLILAASARENDVADSGWKRGALRYGSDTDYYWFNHQYGFGAVDAGAAVALANRWTNVGPMRTGEVTSDDGEVAIATFGTPSTQTVTFSDSDVDFIEFVEITVDLDHLSFRDLKIELESPSGATSLLVHSAQLRDPFFMVDLRYTQEGAIRFGSAKHLGENPDGEWTLRITDERLTDWDGTLKNFRLKVYGHTPAPGSVANPSATTVGDALRVTWTAPGTSTVPANSYDVRYIPGHADKADPNWTVVTGVWTAGDLSYDLTGLTHAVRYDVQVRAVNVPQPGPWSESVIGIVGAAPGILLTPATLTVPEGGSREYTVELASQPTADVTVAMSQSGSTDVRHSADNSLTFTAATWASPQTVTVWAAHDADYDDDTATISHSVTSTDTGYQGISGGDVEVTVADDEKSPLTVSFGASTYNVAEGRSEVVTVRLSPEPDRMVTIPFDRRHEGGATSADYTGVPDSVVFNSGVTEQTFTVTAVNDTVNDDDEYIDLAFGMLPTGVAAGSPSETSIKITDDDFPDAVTVRFEESSYNVAESDDSTTPDVFENQVELTVTLSLDPDRTVRIPLILTNEHGARDADYSIVPTVLTFNDGDTKITSTFTAAHDTDDDDDESVAIGFGNLPPGVIRGDGTTVNIADDDGPRVNVSFGDATYTVPEGGTQSVTVSLSADPEQTVVIPITTTNQGTTPDADYSGVPANVTFSAGGSLEQTFTFTAAQDAFDDDGESVRLAFGPDLPRRVSRGNIPETVVSITDDDDPEVRVSFGSATYSVPEGGTRSVTVNLSADPERTVTIPIATSPQLTGSTAVYTVPMDVTFARGEISKSIIFRSTQDSIDNDGESVKLSFGAPLPDGGVEGTTKETVVSITDDDAPAVTVSFGSPTYSVPEGGTQSVTVRLSPDPERSVVIRISAAGQDGAGSGDYSITPASLTFNSGGREQKTFTFTAVGDTDDDDGESVKLSFSSLPDGVTAIGTTETVVSIRDDDDPAVTVKFGAGTYPVDEGGSVEVTVTLSADPKRTVDIPLSAAGQGGLEDADYGGVPASVTFYADSSPGPREQTFSVTATDDRIDDDGESLRLTFGIPPDRVRAVSPSSATVSFADDDVAGVTLSETSLDIGEGGSGDYTVVLTSEPTADVTIEARAPASSDLTVNPSSLTFTSGNWDSPQTVAVSAADDNDFSDDTGTITHRVTSSDSDYNNRSVGSVAVTVDDDEEVPVTVRFGSADYTVAEGGTVDVTVSLNRDPKRTVTIPIERTNRDGAGGPDYSGVPSSVPFDSGDTLKTIIFEATQDSDDDDGESVRLSFGGLPDAVTEAIPSASTISITDDDHPIVSVSFKESSYDVNEGGSVNVMLMLSEAPGRSVTIQIDSTNLGDASAADYSVPGAVTFRRNDTEKSISFRATQDSLNDDGESVRLALSSTLPDRVEAGSPSSATVSITDDDGPGVLITPPALTVPEGGSRTYTVELTSQPTASVTVSISTSGSSTTVTHDDADNTLTFTTANWATSQTVRVSAAEDDADHLDETATISHSVTSSDTDYNNRSVASVAVTVTDDEEVPVTVSFGAANYPVPEGETVDVTVNLNQDPERTVVISITKTNQGGAVNGDYRGVPSSVTFTSSGDTKQTFTVTTVNDTVDDDGERIELSFGTPLPEAVTRGSFGATSIEIRDDDVPEVTVSFEKSSYRVAEGESVEITVRLSADPARDVTVGISASGQGGATEQDNTGADYFGVPPSVTFNAGEELSQTFTITAVNDAGDDDGESIALSFGNLPTGVLRDDGTTVTIDDDDVPDVVVSFGAAAYEVTEGASVGVKVKLNKDPERQLVIPITASNRGTTSDQDYSGVPIITGVTFESGDTEKEISFSATQDSGDDDGESVVIGFGSQLPTQVATGTQSSTTVTIVDDDAPNVTVNFEATSYEVAEGSSVTVRVTLSPDPERSVTIRLTATGQDGAISDDYAIDPPSLALTFASGETEQTLDFTAASDDMDDDGESVKLAIGSLDGVTRGVSSEATFTILDDPDDVPAVTVNFARNSYTVAEDQTAANHTVEVTLTLSPAPERTVTIPILKTELGATSADYGITPGLSLTFASDETEQTLTFTPVDDAIDDDGERVSLALGALPRLVSSGATAAATVSITDNDTRGVTAAPTSLRIDEGSTGRYTVVLTSEPTGDVTVEITPPTNTDITVNAVSLTFTPTNWDLAQTVTVTALQESDDTDDADDTGSITHTVRSSGDYASARAAAVSVTVLDDEDPQVRVEFDQVTGTVAEGGGAITFTVTLSKDPERTITIPISVTHHDGASSADYTLSAPSVTFNSGQRSKQIMLTAVDDEIDDDGESVTLGFGELPVGVAAGTVNEVTVSITDNDDPSVTVRFERTTYTVKEGESISVNAILSPDPKRTVMIEFASEDVASGNYILPGNVTFNAGQTRQGIDFTATDDDVDDDSRQVIVRFDTSSLDNVAAGNPATVRITDDDTRGVTVSAAVLTVDEGLSDSYDVVLTSEPTDDVSVAITAPAGSDISVDPETLTFTTTDWSSPKTVTVSAAADDMDAEDDTGTITHAVSGGDYGSVSVGSVSVTVDDDEVSVSFERAAYSVAEGGDAVTVTVRLSAPAKQRFTIDLVKTEDGATEDDYSGLHDSLTFAPGDAEQSFSFSALEDTEADDGESVLLKFDTLPAGVIAGELAQATLTITSVIRSTGTGGVGGGGGGGGGPVPSSIEFEWNVTRDIEALDSGHEAPTGAWSDGTLLWLAENGDGADDAVYAYDLVTGERVEAREFELDESNRAPRGLWSNGKTAWVADSGQDRLFAYDLESGERDEEREVAFDTRNRDPRGIWSDGTTVWVLDGGKNALFAYDLASGELIAEYTLDPANGDPRGLWSDGVSVWVSDHDAKRLFAYRLAAQDAETTTGEDEEAAPLERARDEEFTELSRASNNSPRGIWSDGEVMYVADESDGRVYSYNLPGAIDARLASLTLGGVEFGEFDPGRTEYEGVPGDGVTETTVEAEAAQRGATLAIAPADAGEATDGHQLALGGVEAITVTVTSADASRTRMYVVRFGGASEEPSTAACLRGDVAVGFSLVVSEGGGVEELEDCAQERHVTALYALDGGGYVPYILGAPDFVNRSFRELFTAGVPPVTPLIAKSEGPPTADPGSGRGREDSAPRPWPECLRGAIATGFSLVFYEGGGVGELASCAGDQGVTALYTLQDGRYVPYIVGAPDFVNRSFRGVFADGVPLLTPLIVKSDGP